MSVLLPKEDSNCSSAVNSIRDKSPRQKGNQPKQQQSRDSLHLVNEKNAANLQPIEQDEDSETENLSPLLYHKNKKSTYMKPMKKLSTTAAAMSSTTPIQFQPPQQSQQSQSALHIDGVEESIDDTDTDIDERNIEVVN